MSVQSFTCDEEFCGKYREEIRLDETFCCPRHKRCLGHKLLILPPLPAPRPFWKTAPFVAAVTLAVIAASGGLIFASFVYARLQKPPPVPTAVKVDLRFECQTLVASAQNLLRLWEAKLIAQDTAQTKRISEQLVSPAGRTSEESLDRVKATSHEQGRFSDIAQQRQNEILSEMSNYIEIAKRVAAFSPATIGKVFDSFHQATSLSAREELAIGLAQRHALQQAEGRLELKRVYADYESAAFR
jgi:hypothetical protein